MVYIEICERTKVRNWLIPLHVCSTITMLLSKQRSRSRQSLLSYSNVSLCALCRLCICIYSSNGILMVAIRNISIEIILCCYQFLIELFAIAVYIVSLDTFSCNIRFPRNLYAVQTRELLSLYAQWAKTCSRLIELNNHCLRRYSIVAFFILIIIIDKEAHHIIISRNCACTVNLIIISFRSHEDMLFREVYSIRC